MAYTGAKTTRFFSGTIGKPGAAPDLSWTEYHCRAGNALNDVKASVLFKGSTGNARDGSRTVTLYDLVTNQNPNDNGKPFPEELDDDYNYKNHPDDCMLHPDPEIRTQNRNDFGGRTVNDTTHDEDATQGIIATLRTVNGTTHDEDAIQGIIATLRANRAQD